MYLPSYGICGPSVSSWATTGGRQRAFLRKRGIPSIVSLYGYQPWKALQASILPTPWPYCMLLLDTGKVERGCGNSLQYKIQPANFQIHAMGDKSLACTTPPLVYIIKFNSGHRCGLRNPGVLLFPPSFCWENYLFQPCLSAESAGYFW